ncbi:hypothetical protein, partial [Klebsiella aerogenes]|uniref:hypothetical protein n=1 Tax=Klebsiella aerogenes TaxID=548 RepID=UPI001BCAEBEA
MIKTSRCNQIQDTIWFRENHLNQPPSQLAVKFIGSHLADLVTDIKTIAGGCMLKKSIVALSL